MYDPPDISVDELARIVGLQEYEEEDEINSGPNKSYDGCGLLLTCHDEQISPAVQPKVRWNLYLYIVHLRFAMIILPQNF